MRVSELASIIGCECVQEEYADGSVDSGYTSDLLSDVMANAASGGVLVTIQAHRNTIAVASLVGLAAVVICNDRLPPEDMLEAARAERIAVFRTGLSQFEVSGRLWIALRPRDA
ncbi:MAG: hypothetical protein M0Z80_12125 [Treponema sp.]|nr:hypothetical protein [Treponema sp.]